MKKLINAPHRLSPLSKAQVRRSLELAALEPRMLLCAQHGGGLDHLPDNLGTFAPIHSDVHHDHGHGHDDDHGHHHDPVPTDTGGGGGAVSGASVPVSPSAVPNLHSLPGATAKLYLDFSGSNDPSWGSYSPGVTPAYSQDGDTTTFTDSEIASMREIWARVAEKYSPFKIDVTTQDPGNLNNLVTEKVVFGGSGAWLGQTAGGVSYVGGFYNSAPNVAFVFTNNLGAGNAKYSAEAGSHEAGHGFGLQHQSSYSGSTKTAEYYAGDSATAPIMGNSYYAARGLWWYGTSAVSSGSMQDDMAVLSNTANGFGYRTDDRGNSISAASSLGSASSFASSGFIERTSDADYFSFTTTGGSLTLVANTIAAGATLDMKLELRNASNTVIASSDLAGASAEQFSLHLSAGTYYIAMASHGSYGDVGQYSFNGSIALDVVVTVADPTALSATAVSTSQVNLAWADNATNETNYLVQRSTDGGTSWVSLATLGADATSFIDTTVGEGLSYLYRVQAYNATVSSNYSNTASVTTPSIPQAPAAPLNVVATANSSSQITLAWGDVSTETGYRVQRSGDGGANWTVLGNVAANVTSYADSGLTASTTYSYRVYAFNGVGDSAASSVAQATTAAVPLVPTKPNAPSNVQIVEISKLYMVVQWTDNSDNEAGFSVERSKDGHGGWTIVKVAANTTSFQSTGLKANQLYYYRVRAYNALGYSAYSNMPSAKTLLTLPPGSTVSGATSTVSAPQKVTHNAVFSTSPIRVL